MHELQSLLLQKLQSNKDPDWGDWNNGAIVELTRVLSKIEEIENK